MKARTTFYLGILTFVATTLLFYFGLLSNACWFLIWLYPIPVMLYSFSASRQATILVSFLSFATASLTVIVPQYTTSVLPEPMEIIPSLLHSLVFAAIIILNNFCIRRIPFWLTAFVMPSFYIFYQFLWSFSSLANFIHFGVSTQINCLPLLQIGSLIGPLGIGFLTHFFASSIATAIYFRRKTTKWLTILLILSIVFSSVLGFGFYRLAHPQPTPSIKVSLGTKSPHGIHKFSYISDAEMKQRIAEYPAFIESLAVDKPLFIMTPEVWLRLDDSNRDKTLHAIEAVAKKVNSNIITANVLTTDNQAHTNTAWVISRQGMRVGSYDKIHLIPEIEDDFKAGITEPIFTLDNVRFGIEIGIDMLFRQPSVAYGRQGVQIVFMPSADSGLHGTADERRRAAIVHTVSNGMALARAAVYGELVLADAYGRKQAVLVVPQGMTGKLEGEVQLGFGKTFYSLHPYFFAYCCLGLVLLITFLLLLRMPKLRRRFGSR